MKPAARPPSVAAAPDVGATCRRLGIELSAAQTQRLVGYVELLVRWNAVYNLTAIRDPARIWTHHLFDCLAVVGPLRRHRAGHTVRRLLDVGSGAGLPGLVLAIAEPDLSVVCVDSVGKKAAFIRQAAAQLGLDRVTALHQRVETLDEESFDLITSRAYASLADFTASTRHLLAAGGMWMAMKGKVPASELGALEGSLSFHVEQLDVPGLDAERCLVWMRPL